MLWAVRANQELMGMGGMMFSIIELESDLFCVVEQLGYSQLQGNIGQMVCMTNFISFSCHNFTLIQMSRDHFDLRTTNQNPILR